MAEIIDLWAGDDDLEYKENRFYTHSTNRKGFKDTVRIPLPPNVLAQMNAIVQQRKVADYKTVQDLVRDAIIHRLKWLVDYTGDEEMDRAVDREVQSARMEQIRNECNDWMMVYSLNEEALYDLKAQGDKEGIEQLLEVMRQYAAGIRNPYQERFYLLIMRYERQV